MKRFGKDMYTKTDSYGEVTRWECEHPNGKSILFEGDIFVEALLLDGDWYVKEYSADFFDSFMGGSIIDRGADINSKDDAMAFAKERVL